MYMNILTRLLQELISGDTYLREPGDELGNLADTLSSQKNQADSKSDHNSDRGDFQSRGCNINLDVLLVQASERKTQKV